MKYFLVYLLLGSAIHNFLEFAHFSLVNEPFFWKILLFLSESIDFWRFPIDFGEEFLYFHFGFFDLAITARETCLLCYSSWFLTGMSMDWFIVYWIGELFGVRWWSLSSCWMLFESLLRRFAFLWLLAGETPSSVPTALRLSWVSSHTHPASCPFEKMV